MLASYTSGHSIDGGGNNNDANDPGFQDVRNQQAQKGPGIFSAQGGQPFTVTLSSDPSATGTTAHPNRIADGNLPASQRNIHHWFDATAFVAPVCLCFGNSGRGVIRGPGFIDLDFSVTRDSTSTSASGCSSGRSRSI
jgi:hypothetical protein